jgi:transposase
MSQLAIGWDLHRKFSQVSVMRREADGELRVLERARLDHSDREMMLRWLSRQPPGTPVAMEGAFGWQWVADFLLEAGFDPRLGHPPKIKALSSGEAKCDRRDADRCARLQLRDTFPECYLAPPEVRQIRERTRFRQSLVAARTEAKNRVQALLHRLGILHDLSDLFGKKGRQWLKELMLGDAYRNSLDGWLSVIDVLEEQIREVEAWMNANLVEDTLIRHLRSIPGIGLILAHVIHAEIGELTRFVDRLKLTAYAGLAPLSDDSADRHGRRHISRYCNHTLRWAFIEAATGALKSKSFPERLRKLHNRLTGGNKFNKNVAKVAVARELCELVYVIWKTGTPYTQNPPSRPGAAGGQSSLRSEQPRHPMVRRQANRRGQTPK